MDIMSEVNICKYNHSGFRKYKDKCRRKHYSENCEDKSDCKAQNCPKRHPKECKNITKAVQCKYGDKYAYNHDVLTKETDYATLLEAVAHLMQKNMMMKFLT